MKLYNCYCKKCKRTTEIIQLNIDNDDKLTINLDCNHKRVYQLTTSTDDCI